MKNAYLEHANLTVTDPDATAELLVKLFDWKIRWSGEALDQGYTVHVGGDASYVALYTPPSIRSSETSNHLDVLNLNHLGVVVDDIDAVERTIKAHGLTPFKHANYEPGQRFYFHANDQLEIEVISYA